MDRFRHIYSKHIRIIPGVRSYVVAAALIFIFGLTITLFAWYADKQRAQEQANFELSQQAESVRNAITNRLNVYEQVLRGTTGLFSATEKVDKQKWDSYIGQFDITDAYPGISGVGYAPYISDSHIADFIQQQQAANYPQYKVWPDGQRSEYTPVTFITSARGATQVSVGFDIATDPVRRQAMNRARDTGEVVISDRLTLVSDLVKNETQSSGFAMYAAIYDGPHDTIEARRQNVSGYVFTSFRSDYFFEVVTKNVDTKAYRSMSVYDGGQPNDIRRIYQTPDYTSSVQSGTSPPFQATFFEHPWTLQFAGPTSSYNQTQRPWIILGVGTLLSAVVAGLLFLVMFMRARDIIYLKQKETQQAKDDLLSLASHQLRTPATATKQYVGMVLEGYMGRISQKQRSALQKAYISNERQLEIINQILYVAKADAGRLSINPIRFNMNRLVDDVLLDLADALQERDQKIELDYRRDYLYVIADEVSIRMVIENLMSNASKYSFKGETIRVCTGVKDDRAYVSITDSGVGIHPDDFDKLFKKFSRIDNELSVKVGGSGIGLYIDKVLVELHNGTIEVESVYGKGSTFTIYLPRKPADNLTDKRKESG